MKTLPVAAHLWDLCQNLFPISHIQAINYWRRTGSDIKSNRPHHESPFILLLSNVFIFFIIRSYPLCRYHKFYKRCLNERKKLGIGCSEVHIMILLYQFIERIYPFEFVYSSFIFLVFLYNI